MLKDKAVGTLATEDAALAIQYTGCQEKHQSAVDVYDRTKAEIEKFIEDLKKVKVSVP